MGLIRNFFGGGAAKLVEAGTAAYSAVRGNKAEAAAQDHADRGGARAQFSGEFQPVGKRNWVDNWNRLPRPMFATMAIIAPPVAIWMVFNRPDEYMLLLRSLELIPMAMWGLWSMIVAFFFGGRWQAKRADLEISKTKLKEFADAVAKYHEANKPDSENVSSGAAEIKPPSKS